MLSRGGSRHRTPAAAHGELDEVEQFDIDFAVMAGELAKLLDDVLAALGTEVRERAAAA